MNTVYLLTGDAATKLRELPDNCVHCCVTSPPYFGLRSYGVGAEAGEIGLEKTPDEFIANLVSVFREVRRVLRDDGSCWIVIGDSYARTGGTDKKVSQSALCGSTRNSLVQMPDRKQKAPVGVKEKDLLMIPARLAIALRDDGWYLRSNIVWTKGSALPESVKDRPTSNHESIFMLTKSPKYFYDGFAVAESPADSSLARIAQVNFDNQTGGDKAFKHGTNKNRSARKTLENFATNPTRQLRNHWHINPEPLREQHFATYPTRLASRVIQAATSEHGVCADCGNPYKRIVAKGEPDEAHMAACGADASGGYSGESQKDYGSAKAQNASATKARILAGMKTKQTVGWEKTCSCTTDIVNPALVLDPFSGAGTSALCAVRLGRDAVGLDLNGSYHDIAATRISNPTAKCLDTAGERLPFKDADIQRG